MKQSEYLKYQENDIILTKGNPCTTYNLLIQGNFLIYFHIKIKLNLKINLGDITIIDDITLGDKQKIIKTISGGTLFGHKIKEKYNFYGQARNEIHIISIDKTKFDDAIDVNYYII